MDKYILESVYHFENALIPILGHGIIDIILHGSTVDGGFVKGKGDVDFLVLLDRKATEEEFERIKDYHREIRKTSTLEKQFEGCYLSLNKEKTSIENGLYIGTGEKGWRRFEGNIFSQMDMAHILENYYSLKNCNLIENILKYDWDSVKSELLYQLESNIKVLDQNDGYDFKLHILHTSARSLYTLQNRKFISKKQSLEWLEENPHFNKYKEFISFIKNYKSLLSNEEIREISKIGFSNLKELIGDMLITAKILTLENTSKIKIRPAKICDMEIINEIAYKSEAFWGYDTTFMENFKILYSISEEFIKNNITYIMEENEKAIGFYSIILDYDKADLEYFYITPENIGKGYGRLLWSYMIRTCKDNGIQKIVFVTSPQAKDFYIKVGASHTGDVESLVLKDRKIPKLTYKIN